MKSIIAVLAAILIGNIAIAQIPNSGFESWTTAGGYSTPTGWDNLNHMTTAMSVYTCSKGTPGDSGTSYLQLNSQTVAGMGVVPGVAVSGLLDTSDMANIKPLSGFPFTMRPAQFVGNWQYMASGTDQGFISVVLTKWNIALLHRDTVAFVTDNLAGMVMAWARFSINLNYISSAYPDSAIIFLSASKTGGAVTGSTLFLDNLAFAGSVSTAVTNPAHSITATSVYPNPATTCTNVSFESTVAGNITVELRDISGRTVKQIKTQETQGANTLKINTADLPKGQYFLSIADGQNNVVKKIVIQ